MTKKKALEIHAYLTQDFWSIDQKKKTTIIVDADDKNCLAQLTVAPKLDQSR